MDVKNYFNIPYNPREKHNPFGSVYVINLGMDLLREMHSTFIGSMPRKRIFKYKSTKERKKRERKIFLCVDCGKQITRRAITSRCEECSHIRSRKVERPSKETLEQLIQSKTPWLQIGKMYRVSDNAVRKWARRYGITW